MTTKDHHPAEAPVAYEDALKEYVEDYEMIGETEDGRDASYTPTQRERILIEDAIRGWEDPETTKLREAGQAMQGRAQRAEAQVARVRDLADDFDKRIAQLRANGGDRGKDEAEGMDVCVTDLRAALEGK
jgi:hypothetical protein